MTIATSFKEKVIYLTLFFIAFIYMNFFALSVPYFWDCPWFIFHDPGQVKVFIKQALTITQNRFEGDRPVMNLFFYFNTLLFGKDYFYLRIIKNIFFAFYIIFSYALIRNFIRERFFALMGVFFLVFSFPVFIHTVVFSEPFIYTEPLKIFAFLLFLSDFLEPKSSITRQVFVALFLHLAFKSYAPTYSAFITLFLFIIFADYRKLNRYVFLLTYLFLLNFPLGKLIHPAVSQETTRVSLNLSQFYTFFIKNTLRNAVKPPSFENIYYKSFIQVVTPVIAGAVIFYSARLMISARNKFFQKNKVALCFASAYLLPELFIWFVLPEPASRYFSSQALPIALLSSIIFMNANKYLKTVKPFKGLMLLLMIAYAGYNFTYTYLYRATWLSTEIGKRKVADYIEDTRKSKTIVLYEAENAAPGYFPLNLKKDFYKLPKDIEYRPATDYNNAYLKTLSGYPEVYVVQKETSLKKRLVPNIKFNNRPDLELVKVIAGDTDSLFDVMNKRICAILRVGYQPNYFYIYRYKAEGR